MLLAVVHEVLLAPARPPATGEDLYLQLVVLAQCAFLVASTAALVAVAPRLSRAVATLTFTLPVLLYVDTLVVLRIDQHLPSVLRLLWSAGVDDNRRLLEATGIDLRALTILLAGLAVAGAAGAWLDGMTADRSAAWTRWTRGTVLLTWIAATAALVGLERGAAYVVRASSWARFGRSVPLVLGVFGPPTRARASVRAVLRAPPSEGATSVAIARLEVPATPPPGDVFFFVVESLRGDAVDPATTPAMAALAREAIPITLAVSGGDVTQYGWYALFRSRAPLYWDLDRQGDGAGAAPLRVARRRGWRIEALSSSDLRYMHLDEVVLGAGHPLADDVFDASGAPGTSATRDVQVMTELAARVARPHAPTVYIVGLDATHLPYLWTDDFDPPLRPFAGPRHYMQVQSTAADRLAVVNRYRDSVAFVDSLLRHFFVGLRAAGTYDDATIVVAGDHGEEFWEHGLTAHASEVCSAQTHITLLISPSRAMRAEQALRPVSLASGVDVWPTLLDAAGVRGDTSALFDGRSLLAGPTGAALAVHQAYWHRPGKFVFDDGQQKVLFEMTEPDHPLQSQTLLVLERLDEADQPTHAAATPGDYVAGVRSAFGPDLDRFFDVRW
jgi:membrane-anchored protein YejM (alkaline phosphatase superfamily)